MLFAIIAAVVTILDQLSKLWVTAHIRNGADVHLIPSLIDITYSENTGAAFSFMKEHTGVLTLVSVLGAALIIWLITRKDYSLWEKIGLSLALGGAVGNLIDRAMLHHVVDMIRFLPTGYTVFNVADVFINVGAGIFLILLIVRTVREERETKAAKAGGDADPEKPEDAAADTADAEEETGPDAAADTAESGEETAAESAAEETPHDQ